jgi:hypothetical protein
VTYRLVVPPSIRPEIEKLPSADLAGMLRFFDGLRTDPDAVTGPFGDASLGPVRMRSAGVGRAIVVVLVNDLTQRVTLVRVQQPFAD